MKFTVFFFSLLVTFSVYGDVAFLKKQFLASYNYEKMQSYDEAIKTMLLAHKNSSDNFNVNLRLGWLYYINKKYANSLHFYQSAIKIVPKALKPKNGIVLCYLAQAKLVEAERTVYEVLKLDHYNYYGNLYLTNILIRQKKHELAKNIVLKMLRVYPADVTFLTKLLDVSVSLKEDKQTQAVLHKILMLDPNNIYANSFLAKPLTKKK